MDPLTAEILIRPLRERDRRWARGLLTDRWGSDVIVSRGHIHQASALPGLVAERNAKRLGLLTYSIRAHACEVVSLDSLEQGIGVGGQLLRSLEDLARAAGCARLWLVTTNDNQYALEFYTQRGFKLVAVHKGSLEKARLLKPEIPMHGISGIPVEDEWEFERLLSLK